MQTPWFSWGWAAAGAAVSGTVVWGICQYLAIPNPWTWTGIAAAVGALAAGFLQDDLELWTWIGW